ncbi:MAG: JAB domain-containing protein [Sphingobium sp.]
MRSQQIHFPWPPNLLENPSKEMSSTLFFNAHDEIIDLLTIYGEERHVIFPIEEIVRRAANGEVRKLLLYHTHPSGNPAPSQADIVSTRKLCVALKNYPARLVDHLIFAGDKSFSFRANAML